METGAQLESTIANQRRFFLVRWRPKAGRGAGLPTSANMLSQCTETIQYLYKYMLFLKIDDLFVQDGYYIFNKVQNDENLELVNDICVNKP